MSFSSRFDTWLSCTLFLVFLALISFTAADVTIIPGNPDPRPYNEEFDRRISSIDELFQTSAFNEAHYTLNDTHIITSSADTPNGTISKDTYASSDSFVRSTIQAWGQHHHLVIRPDEVWFTILAQMNFYMNDHAEDVRDVFVTFEGKQEIRVFDRTWHQVIDQFAEEIQKRVKTPWLLDWMMPEFSTSTDNDATTATVLMMGLFQAYFDYLGGIICGLPSVTLLGTKADWERLLAKLDHLPDFGAEPTMYQGRLKPILSRFVESFDKPSDPKIREFWNSIINAEPQHLCGGPPYRISGWLTGFISWDKDGKYMATGTTNELLDGISYPSYEIDKLPIGYAGTPITLLDYPRPRAPKFPAYIIAGNLGKEIKQTVPAGYLDALASVNSSLADIERAGLESTPKKHWTVQPLNAWLMYGPVPTNETNRRDSGDTELNNLFGSANGAAGAAIRDGSNVDDAAACQWRFKATQTFNCNIGPRAEPTT
ncbi:hypothetical protein P152DRAFT_507895 [Eremomyces bilateralis CBS 781.70]|uniref:DUF4419 domain-containing protein n=1 Tax=Eremomyces bilateralis CBS 781.70 TaxID=1392243 RepID=A0A6G1G103_9PEZI|nr:uncharacterized protein P152DRAFT_507895 [Eremomyces bilateralis CBS 781.70]KAF1811698.1 hypothetical protein P152DRAFT_507895 [Eremomyces bilateralis CBS 781.70]